MKLFRIYLPLMGLVGLVIFASITHSMNPRALRMRIQELLHQPNVAQKSSQERKDWQAELENLIQQAGILKEHFQAQYEEKLAIEGLDISLLEEEFQVEQPVELEPVEQAEDISQIVNLWEGIHHDIATLRKEADYNAQLINMLTAQVVLHDDKFFASTKRIFAESLGTPERRRAIKNNYQEFYHVLLNAISSDQGILEHLARTLTLTQAKPIADNQQVLAFLDTVLLIAQIYKIFINSVIVLYQITANNDLLKEQDLNDAFTMFNNSVKNLITITNAIKDAISRNETPAEEHRNNLKTAIDNFEKNMQALNNKMPAALQNVLRKFAQ